MYPQFLLIPPLHQVIDAHGKVTTPEHSWESFCRDSMCHELSCISVMDAVILHVSLHVDINSLPHGNLYLYLILFSLLVCELCFLCGERVFLCSI